MALMTFAATVTYDRDSSMTMADSLCPWSVRPNVGLFVLSSWPPTYAMSLFLAAIPRKVQQVLSRQNITVDDLLRCLPRIEKGCSLRLQYLKRGIYLIVGRDVTGEKLALYTSTS